MYQTRDTYYTEKHSVSFGEIATITRDGHELFQEFQPVANTWTDWHLIPSSRPVIAHPSIVTKFVEIPGADGMLDLTNYLSGKQNYGQRQGDMAFIVANGFENWETIRMKIVNTLHGKRLKMMLNDDPGYYYEGRFTVGNWESGSSNSAISIGYQLEPYKLKIDLEGNTPTLWDPFNFETDSDYFVLLGDKIELIGEPKSYIIHANEYSFTPYVTWKRGNVEATFGGVTRQLNTARTVALGHSEPGNNTLTFKGTGIVTVSWRGGSL